MAEPGRPHADKFEGPSSLYKDATDYWSSVPATVDGVLGGYGTGIVPKADINGSLSLLLNPLVKARLPERPYRGADCGAGIGRVTKDLLVKFCSKVDLVEPVLPFVTEIRDGPYLEEARKAGLVGEIYPVGLEAWHPRHNTYGIIWCQWCLSQLTDDDLVCFLSRAKAALSEKRGILVVKENCSRTQNIFDQTDSSVTRTQDSFESIFAKAGLETIERRFQSGFPKELFPVIMYVLA